MRLITDALIIRENNNIGESDRFVTALTKELGAVHASARGAQTLKGRGSAATRLLSYSRLTLREGRSRDKYIIEDARPLRVFFDIHGDIACLALAQYFCELAGVLAPREEPAEEHLRLLLNALHFLAENRRDIRQIKAVVELRMLTLSGYMPDLTGCSICATDSGDPIWFLPRDGVLCCGKCEKTGDAKPLSPTILAALRHIVYAPFEKCFAFQIPAQALSTLAETVETFLLCQLNRSFQTLQFYHTLGDVGHI